MPLEPQVLALLRLLIENRQRVVSKAEIIERVWEGRIVSEAAVASRVKSARQAIGDDGSAQRMIRTAHKVGFRFVAEVATDATTPARVIETVAEPRHAPTAAPDPSARGRRSPCSRSRSSETASGTPGLPTRCPTT